MSARALDDLIAQLTPPGQTRAGEPWASLAWGTARASETAPLFASEETAIARAVPKRRAEFMSGRLAARRALAALGHPACAIPPGPDRAPIWPDGLVGSISHEAGQAVAVISQAPGIAAIGVDLDMHAPLPPELIEEVLSPEERQAIAPDRRALLARRAFSAKEALYKAQFPLTGVIFGFHGLRLDLDRNVACFAPTAETEAIPFGLKQARLPYRQVQDSDLILSCCILTHAAQAKNAGQNL